VGRAPVAPSSLRHGASGGAAPAVSDGAPVNSRPRSASRRGRSGSAVAHLSSSGATRHPGPRGGAADATFARPTPTVSLTLCATQHPPYLASQAFIRSFRLAASLLIVRTLPKTGRSGPQGRS